MFLVKVRPSTVVNNVSWVYDLENLESSGFATAFVKAAMAVVGQRVARPLPPSADIGPGGHWLASRILFLLTAISEDDPSPAALCPASVSALSDALVFH